MEWVELIEMVESNKPMFYRVARKLDINLSYDTSYDARNFQFSKVVKKEVHLVDFQPAEGKKFMVTKLIEIYPASPRIFRFLRSVIPMFPFLAKIERHVLGELSAKLTATELESQIAKFAQNAL